MKNTASYFLKKEKLDVNLRGVLDAFANDRNDELQSFRVKRVFNRPFSLVFNIDLTLARQKSESVFLKIYKPYDLQSVRIALRREYEITLYWYEKFRGHPSFHIVEPLWVDFNHFILITRESLGVNLLSFLEKHVRFFPSSQNMEQAKAYLHLAGQWLAFFQQYPVEDDIPFLDTSVRIERDYFLHYINVRMERMVMNPRILFDSRIQKAVNDVITRLCGQIDAENARYCVSHSDLSLSNILINEQHVTVLDFHKSEINSPYKDLTRLYHQLHLLSFKPEYSANTIRQLQTALLQGWGDAQADQHPLFKIYYLIHQITHLGKIARYWEHNFVENLYNRWVVRKTLKQLKEFLAHESQTKN